MDPVDECARLKTEIRRLQDRAEALREGLLRPRARLRSNRLEIMVKRRRRRVFNKDQLPEAILRDPRHWEERDSMAVTCREIPTFRAGNQDVVLIE